MSEKIKNLRNDDIVVGADGTGFTINSKDINEKKAKKKKRRKIILLVVAVVLGIGIAFGADLFLRVYNTMGEIYTPIDTDDLRGEDISLGSEQPFSTLVLGIDSDGPNDFGRSDTMMLITVNPNLNTTYIVSIARDTMVTINGRQTRINHAFAYGRAGAAGSVNAVQDFLNVPIDRYVEIQMDSFEPIIDAVGGIRVYNDTTAFSAGGYHFPLGYVDLTGSSALYFVRMRHDTDYGRQARQRLVTEAMMQDVVGSAVSSRNDLMAAARDHMQTDVSLGDMTSIALNYAGAVGNITNLEMRGYGQMINGMALQVVPEERRLEMEHLLRNHLELD